VTPDVRAEKPPVALALPPEQQEALEGLFLDRLASLLPDFGTYVQKGDAARATQIGTEIIAEVDFLLNVFRLWRNDSEIPVAIPVRSFVQAITSIRADLARGATLNRQERTQQEEEWRRDDLAAEACDAILSQLRDRQA
jgi:hypothetical protein